MTSLKVHGGVEYINTLQVMVGTIESGVWWLINGCVALQGVSRQKVNIYDARGTAGHKSSM